MIGELKIITKTISIATKSMTSSRQTCLYHFNGI